MESHFQPLFSTNEWYVRICANWSGKIYLVKQFICTIDELENYVNEMKVDRNGE